MDPKTMDPSTASTCTTCTYSEDFSNYWTASLYFKSPENGTYKLVPQRTNFRGLDGEMHPQGGGITVYYMTAYGGSAETTAFKPVSPVSHQFVLSQLCSCLLASLTLNRASV